MNRSPQALKEGVEKEIDHNLREWGINSSLPGLTDTEKRLFHSFRQYFRSVAVECALASTTPCKGDHPIVARSIELSSKANEFPKEPKQAAEVVLRTMLNDIVDKNNKIRTNLVEDNIGMSFAPYFLHRTKKKYVLREEYRGFDQTDLNPLKRFTLVNLSQRDYLYELWSNPDSLDGNVFESIVSSYVIFNKPCQHCKTTGSLRWNGGYGLASSWADILCLECQSTYEIKSKKDVEKIRRSLYYGFNGSSYRTFHANTLQTSTRFLLAVSREDGGQGHEVYIAKIVNVYPRLTDISFAVGLSCEDPPIKSEIVTEETTPDHWCTIPSISFNSAQIARSLFEDHFGKGSWNQAGEKSRLREIESDKKKKRTLNESFSRMSLRGGRSSTRRGNHGQRVSSWSQMMDAEEKYTKQAPRLGTRKSGKGDWRKTYN
jgi:hypothetical protein